jgi:flagellar biosynthetic protein FliR
MGFEWIASQRVPAVWEAFLLVAFLLSLRLGALLLLTPMLYAAGLAGAVRVLIVLGLAFALASGLSSPPPAEALLHKPGLLVGAAASELALGATLALGVFATFAAFSFAGRLIDVQIGFGMAQVFDPATRRQVPVLQSAFDHVAVLVFFLVNGHHALLRGVAYTIERFPPGHPWPLAATVPMITRQVASLFSMGVALAAPVVACLLLVELALGIAARNLPQINMFVIGVPVKVVVGLAMLALWFAGLGDAMSRVYAFMFRSWESSFAAFPLPGGR